MDISVVFILVSALAVSSGAGPVIRAVNERVVITVCSTLNQDQQDITMCCDKARGNYFTSGEVPFITYLCCLGYFGDVKKNYMDKITFDLIFHIVKTEDRWELVHQAEFIVQCQDANAPRLTASNYEAWKNNSSTPYCRGKT